MMNWKRLQRRGWNNNGESLLLGTIVVASLVFDPLTARDDPEKYRVDCFLPGMAQNHAYFESPEGGKRHAETLVQDWMNAANVHPENNALGGNHDA